jgi:hypothetical protein
LLPSWTETAGKSFFDCFSIFLVVDSIPCDDGWLLGFSTSIS